MGAGFKVNRLLSAMAGGFPLPMPMRSRPIRARWRAGLGWPARSMGLRSPRLANLLPMRLAMCGSNGREGLAGPGGSREASEGWPMEGTTRPCRMPG